MKKWIVIILDRGLLDSNKDEFEVMIDVEDAEVLAEEGEPTDETYKEHYIELSRLEQIIDYKEIWAFTPTEAAKKILVKYLNCLFLHFEEDGAFFNNHIDYKNWFKNFFMYHDDQKYIDVEEIVNADILIRKELFYFQDE